MRERFIIRKVCAEDIPTVVAIENQQFLHPWKEKLFTSELYHNISYFYLLEDTSSKTVIGYIIFWLIEDMIELHNIAVERDYKKKGLGKKLLEFMLDIGKQKKVKEIFLEVRVSNAEGIGFYEGNGFKRIDIRKDYYSSPTEDAAIYRLFL